MKGQPANPLLTHAARAVEVMQDQATKIDTLEKELVAKDAEIADLEQRLATSETEIADVKTRVDVLELKP